MNHQLALKAGLVYAGTNKEGEMEYIGTDKQWQKYEALEEDEGDKQFENKHQEL